MRVDSNELDKLIEVCTLCGSCNNSCPVFEVDLTEPGSPRGKINLIGEYLKGDISDGNSMNEIMKSCLLCGNCNLACTKGVDFRKILIGYRSLSEFSRNTKNICNCSEKINENIRKLTKSKYIRTDFDILLYSGYTVGRYYPEFIKKAIKIITNEGMTVFVPDDLNNCQSCYKEYGYSKSFKKSVSLNKKKFEELSFKKILCFSERDMLIFEEDYNLENVTISTIQKYLIINYKKYEIDGNLIKSNKKNVYHGSLFEKNFINYSEDNKEFFNNNKIDLEIFHKDCCGSGINFEDTENKYSMALADRFVGKLDDNNIDNLIVSSPECYKWLSRFIQDKIIFLIDIFI